MSRLEDLSEAEMFALAEKMEEARKPWAFVPYGHPITFCPDGWLWREKFAAGEWGYWSNKPWQWEFFKAGARVRQRMLSGGNRLGKAQPFGSMVATPQGWRRIETLTICDEVLGADGKPTRVTGVYYQGRKQVFRVTLWDGSSTRACAEHLWMAKIRYTKSREKEWRTVPTSKLASLNLSHPPNRPTLPSPDSAEFVDQGDLPIPPYIVGVLLGDGSLGRNTGGRLSSADQDIVGAVRQSFPRLRSVNNPLRPYDYHLGAGATKILRSAGIFPMLCRAKTVPTSYLFASTENRLAVLQGLMDTDGTAGSNNCSFSSVSHQLAKDVAFLARSLGGNAKIGCAKAGKPGEHYRVSVSLPYPMRPFRLGRKLTKIDWENRRQPVKIIHAITPDGEEECVCISVAAHDGLYITDDFIVTHNTTTPAVELAFHASGEYPAWWQGARINKPIMAWECATSNQKLRDVNQKQLLGPGGGRSPGGGMIPVDRIKKITFRQCGVDNVVDTIEIFFRSGATRGVSRIQCLTYEQGRKAFQGDKIDYIRLDEEPDPDNIKHEGIFGECQARIFDSRGHLVVTYTPLEGNTEILEHFYKHTDGRWIERAGFYFDWTDGPHLTESMRKEFIESVPEHERPARCRGEPKLGSGKAFTFNEELVLCESFEPPSHAFWIAGHDFGLDHAAGTVWLMIDRTTDTWYIVRSDKTPGESVPTHAYTLRSLGEWIPVAWPHDGHKTQYSLKKEGGDEIRNMYRQAGVNMMPYSARYQTEKGGPQSAEPILLEINNRARTGRLKIFNTPSTLPLREEMRTFHRDDHGKLVHKRDDCVKALFYAGMMSRFATQRFVASQAPAYTRSIAS